MAIPARGQRIDVCSTLEHAPANVQQATFHLQRLEVLALEVERVSSPGGSPCGACPGVPRRVDGSKSPAGRAAPVPPPASGPPRPARPPDCAGWPACRSIPRPAGGRPPPRPRAIPFRLRQFAQVSQGRAQFAMGRDDHPVFRPQGLFMIVEQRPQGFLRLGIAATGHEIHRGSPRDPRFLRLPPDWPRRGTHGKSPRRKRRRRRAEATSAGMARRSAKDNVRILFYLVLILFPTGPRAENENE